ncbi:MAG: nuclear transport factor 2 family protein [Lautropia sp.]
MAGDGHDHIIGAIEALDAERSAATLAADRSALERIIGDDLRYVHGSGADEDKAKYLERLGNGYYDYQSLKVLRRDFRVLGDVVLVNGDIDIDVIVEKTKHKRFTSRYLQVWARRAAGWQMVSWQSTPLPA